VRHHFLALLFVFAPAFITAQGPTPQQIADELLAADRAFAAAGAKTELAAGISAMFAAEVAMPAPGGFAFGSQKAIEALRDNPNNKGARAAWTPARVGVSADGRHGFTAGYMTVHRADGTQSPAKYLAYWEKQAGGWRILAYKRVPAKMPPPTVETSYAPLPKEIFTPKGDAAVIERFRVSLAEAERIFSRAAQKIGLGPAFKQFGSPHAINLGPPDSPTFVLGNEAIATSVSRGGPPGASPVNWGPEKTIVAASGDFGVTIGYLNANQPGADGKTPPPQPFFTIWTRGSLKDPWRYIAE
jgi:ketosteroid isomerase-like protein